MGLRVLLAALWLLIALPARGLAHPDLPVGDQRLTLAPGQEAEVPLSLHFHRLVGEIQAAGGGTAGALRYAITGPDGTRRPIAGPSPSGRLNHLVACCQNELYSPHRLLIRNAGPDPITVDVRLLLIHDDLAVVALNGEPGAAVQTGLIFLALSAWMGLRIVRLRRGRQPAPNARPGPNPARSAVWSLGLFLLAAAGALGAGLLGASAFGGGLVDGMVASAPLLPLPPGPFGSVGSVLMLLLMAPWAAALIIWTRSLRALGAGNPYRLTRIAGLILAAGSLTAAALLSLRYDALSPLIIAAFPVAALLAGVGRTGQARPPGSLPAPADAQ